MSGIAFNAYGKTPRLFSAVTITEKIDGTNGAIGIVPIDDLDTLTIRSDAGPVRHEFAEPFLLAVVDGLAIYAQSRNRLITPGKTTDNMGFAGWVQEHAENLVQILGQGLHYGEWWGKGIARNYGQTEKRFSLFDARRYQPALADAFVNGTPVETLDVVPVLYEGIFEGSVVEAVLADLEEGGSYAAPGFMRPEGVIVRHKQSGVVYKALLGAAAFVPKSLVKEHAA